MPSPSVSGLVGSVPAVASSSFVKPSLSQSAVPNAVAFGSHGLFGSVPFATSIPSKIPSSSLSSSSGSVLLTVSSSFVKPSSSQSFVFNAKASGSQASFGSLVVPFGLDVVFGSSVPVTSSPSFKPSPSVSASSGSVLSIVVFGFPSGPFTSSSFVSPSLSQSPPGKPIMLGSHASNGLVLIATSKESVKPSISVSGLNGSVFSAASSPFVKPSLSQSPAGTANGLGSHGSFGSLGLVPVTSSPSVKPSLSESASVGSVSSPVFGIPSAPRLSSSLVKPSLSQSPAKSANGFGIQILLSSGSFVPVKPSPSSSSSVMVTAIV